MATTVPPPPTDDPESDTHRLIQILNYILAFLDWLLNQERYFTYREDLGLLRESFRPIVGRAYQDIRRELEEPSEGTMSRLETVGLTGTSLAMKRTLLFSDARRGLVKRIIARINSILGSLSSVFPPGDIIKEFKDQTEASMDDLEDQKGPKSLRDLGGKF